MNASGQFVAAGPARTLFGLPVDELGWTNALAHIESLADFQGSRRSGGHASPITIAFDTEAVRLRQVFDRRYRTAFSRWVVLPAGGKLMQALHRLGGSKSSVQFPPDRFVLALLTFLERKRRVGLVGDDADSLQRLKALLASHAPWHDFVEIGASNTTAGDFDLVIVDQQRWEDERKAEQRLAALNTGLVVMTGGNLGRLNA